MDIFHAQVQEGQQHDDSLLLIPGNVVGDGQLVDVRKTEDLLQLQSDDGQRVGIVALACVQHPGNAADLAKPQLVEAVLCAACGQDYRVCRERFGEIRIVAAAFCPAVAASHDHKLTDGAGFHRFHHLVSQGQHLGVGEAADDLPALQLHGRLAALRALDQDGEILSPFRVCADMGAAGIPRGPGGVEPVLIAVAGRHDTVGGHEDGAPEGLEFLLLLPPGVPVIAREMGILFKGRIVMGRQHLRVGVYVYAGSRRLLQQHFQIL